MCQYFRPEVESTPQPTMEMKWFTSDPLTPESTPPVVTRDGSRLMIKQMQVAAQVLH